VPIPAGATADMITRLVAQKLNEAWGQQVIVDNRPGGAFVIGSDIVAKITSCQCRDSSWLAHPHESGTANFQQCPDLPLSGSHPGLERLSNPDISHQQPGVRFDHHFVVLIPAHAFEADQAAAVFGFGGLA